MRKELLEVKMRLADAHIKASMKPFKRYSEIQRWKALYKKVQSRYPFLVLEGSSCTGKTFYAKWMDGDPKYCFECNCACCLDPDLRAFDPFVHETILFDEGTPLMVIRQKKRFQASPWLVSMAIAWPIVMLTPYSCRISKWWFFAIIGRLVLCTWASKIVIGSTPIRSTWMCATRECTSFMKSRHQFN